MHLAAFKNSLPTVQILCNYVIEEESLKDSNSRNQRIDSNFKNQIRVNEKPYTILKSWVESLVLGEEGFSAFHFASFNGNLEMIQYLCRIGADLKLIHLKTTSASSLFHVAAQGDNPNVLAFLKQQL